MKTRIYSPDIECDSCVKVLEKAFSKHGCSCKVSDIHIDVTHDAKIKPNKLIKIIQEKGYRASLHPHMRPRIRDRAKEFLTNRQKYAIEHRMLRYMAGTLALLLLLQVGVLYLVNSIRPGFMASHSWWIFYLTISIVALGGAIWHFKAYRTTVTCMTGMMIGMTIGMQTGMLIGAVIGATNGFFFGAMTGMILASVIGAYIGNCCGIMGVIEGMMAGIMGGTMGAMITVMMFNDHIFLFMPAFVLLNLIILVGFSYMLFEELVEGKEVVAKPVRFLPFAIGCALVLTVLTAVIIFAPPSIFLG